MENKYKIAAKVNMDLEREGAVPELAAVTASPDANLEDKPGTGRVRGGARPWGMEGPRGDRRHRGGSAAPRGCKAGWKC